MSADLAALIADLAEQLRAGLAEQLHAEQVRGYRAETAAKLLDLPYRTVMNLIHSGELGHRMAGRYYLVPHAEIQRWLAEAAADKTEVH